MKTSEIRKKSAAEITKVLGEHEAELRTFRFGMSGSHTKNVKRARAIRKDIARIKTVLNETK
jgi:ribosomal protein L29